MKVLIIMSSLLLLVSSAFADDYTGTELLKDCKLAVATENMQHPSSTVEIIKGGRCVGYVMGIENMMEMEVAKNKVFCPPKDIIWKEVVQKVIQQLETEPGLLDSPAVFSVVKTLYNGFPCKKE